MSLRLLEAGEGGARRLQRRRVMRSAVSLFSLTGRRWHWAGMGEANPRVISIDRVLPSSELAPARAASFDWRGLEFCVVGASNLFQALCGFDPWLGAQEGDEQHAEGVSWRLRDVVAVLNNFWSGSAGWVQPIAEWQAWSAGRPDLMALECSIWSDQGLWLDRFWLVPLSSREPLENLPGMLRSSGLAERPAAQYPAVPLRLDAVMGEVAMPAAQFAALEVGDAVLFSQSRLHGLDRLEIDFGVGRMKFRVLGSSRLELMEPVDFSTLPRRVAMDDELEMGDLSIEVAQGGRSAPARSSDALLNLPVRLMAVAGSLNVSVGDIARLKVGDCLDLDSPAQPFVRLVANGKDVGLGELVEIDGKLGVQIARLDVES